MKLRNTVFLLFFSTFFSFPSFSNPCAYMIPVIRSGFELSYFEGLAGAADRCMPINEYKSPACPSLESKFGVDLNRFKSDDDYRAYIKLLAHEPIRKHVNNSLVSASLMLEELESSGNELVVDEMLKLKRLGPNISIDAIGSSMSRIKGAGLCL